MMNIPEGEVIYLDGEMEICGDGLDSKSSIGDDCEDVCGAAIVRRILIGAKALATAPFISLRIWDVPSAPHDARRHFASTKPQ